MDAVPCRDGCLSELGPDIVSDGSAVDHRTHTTKVQAFLVSVFAPDTLALPS